MNAPVQGECTDLDDLQILRVGDRCVAVVDCGGWTPRLHFIEQTASGEGDPRVIINALGLPVGRQRAILVREMRRLLSAASLRTCSPGYPESVTIDVDVVAVERVCGELRELPSAHVRCTEVCLRSRGPMDPGACRRAVLNLYSSGVYRIRVVLRDDDVCDPESVHQLVALLRGEGWSVVPALHVSWDVGAAHIFSDRRWREMASNVYLSGYWKESAGAVLERLAGTNIEIVRFELPVAATDLRQAVDILLRVYAEDAVPQIGDCWPFSHLIASLKSARLRSPVCVRRLGRRVIVDENGLVTCCPRFKGLEEWAEAIRGERYWECASRWIESAVRGCCTGGRLLNRECLGAVEEGCPSANCEVGRGVLLGVLGALRESIAVVEAEPPSRLVAGDSVK